jgi:acetyl esterase/lipase
VKRVWLVLFGACSLLTLPAGDTSIAETRAIANQPKPPVTKAASGGVWQPATGQKQVPIWPNGVPDMTGVSQPPERMEVTKAPDLVAGRPYTAVYDVSVPTMTIFQPRGKNTGVSMIVFPGGGFQLLAVDLEGTEICDWMTAKGITCVLLKYRVPKSADYWDTDCKCRITPKVPRALQDAQRTIRLVRARANELHLNPHKIGVLGMSAGGYLVAQTSNIFDPVYAAVDATDQVSSRPDFAIALYPGHICRSGAKLNSEIHVTDRTPPTFILQAWTDPVDDVCNSTLYARALDDAHVPAEVHLFAKGGHAFGLRRTSDAITSWPSLVENWLREINII